mgnify:CR=1 FL=1
MSDSSFESDRVERESIFTLDFAYAYGKPTAKADFRSELEDFVVDEIIILKLSFEQFTHETMTILCFVLSQL